MLYDPSIIYCEKELNEDKLNRTKTVHIHSIASHAVLLHVIKGNVMILDKMCAALLYPKKRMHHSVLDCSESSRGQAPKSVHA